MTDQISRRRKGTLRVNEAFAKLEESKQKKILDAAFREFAENGYARASTDQIVRDAGIGKGTLFYYFNNKKELYRDLVDISVRELTGRFLGQASGSGDYLERYKQASMLKMKAYHERPDMLNFLGRIYLEPDESLTAETAGKLVEIRKTALSSFLACDDDTPFRADIPREKILSMIKWLMDGYEKEMLANFHNRSLSSIDVEPYWDDYNDFLELLKKLFYTK